MKTMKKLVSFVLTSAILALSMAPAFAEAEPVLSDTTWVNVDNTSDTIFAKASAEEYHADSNYYLHFNTAGDWLEVNQTLAETAEAGNKYVITVDAKPVSGQLWLRVGWDGDDGAWMAINADAEGIDLGNGYKRYSREVTMAGDQNTMIIHNAGAVEWYIDRVSLKAADGTEFMIDADFDAVSYDAITGTIGSTSMNLPSATETTSVKLLRENQDAENTYSLHMYTTGDHLEISQSFTEALAAGTYTLTAYAKGTGNLWYYQNWGTEWAKFDFAYGEPQPDGWTEFTAEIAVDGNGDTSFLIHTEGAVDLYLDDISLVDANGVNYIVDGGFGEVTVPGQEPEEPEEEPEEELILSSITRVNVENTDTTYAKATAKEYHADSNYYLHYKTAGDWLEVNQTLAETAIAGNKYVITVDAKPVSGQIWLRVGWDGDDGAWMAINADAEGIDLGNGYKRYIKEVTMAGDQETMILYNGGAAEWYLDKISVTAEDGTEIMMDAGFDAVSYDAVSGTIKSTSMNLPNATETTSVKLLRENQDAENEYSLHMYTTEAYLEISQDFTEPLAAGTYILTAYAKGTGNLWYYQNWGTEWAKFDFAYGEPQPDGWTKFTKEIAVDGDGDTSFLVHTEGAVDLYLDDISLVDANGVNYIVDGGFGEVTDPNKEPDYEISELTYEGLTEDGKLQQGSLKAKTTIRNISMGDKFKPVMVVALYDGARFKYATSTSQPVSESPARIVPADEYELTIDIPASTETSAYKVKVMLWNGFDTMEKIIDAAELK